MIDEKALLFRGRSRLSSDRAVLAGELIRAYETASPKERAALRRVRQALVDADSTRFAKKRAQLRAGRLRGDQLLRTLRKVPPERRDAFVEALFGIAWPPFTPQRLPDESVPYVPCGVDAVITTLLRVPLRSWDTFVDLGAGLGKVLMLAKLLTGARCIGVELQPALAAEGRARFRDLKLNDIEMRRQDIRRAKLDAGTVFFLYAPFKGRILEEVLAKLRAVAQTRPIVVIAVGVSLDREGWLIQRPSANLWVTISDSVRP